VAVGSSVFVLNIFYSFRRLTMRPPRSTSLQPEFDYLFSCPDAGYSFAESDTLYTPLSEHSERRGIAAYSLDNCGSSSPVSRRGKSKLPQALNDDVDPFSRSFPASYEKPTPSSDNAAYILHGHESQCNDPFLDAECLLFSRQASGSGSNVKAALHSPRFPPGHLLHPLFTQTYLLGDELGSGGYGFVMTARHLTAGLEVAVKFIIKEKVPDGAWMEIEARRLPTEIMLLGCLNHENIVKCLDLFEDELYFYLVIVFFLANISVYSCV
jgi:hypothetical protein